MLLTPSLFSLVFTCLALGLWFKRRENRDADIWMYATYAGIAIVSWQHYLSASTMSEGIPLIIRDFILIGIVGLVQSMAVAKRIPIWLAIVLIFGLFLLAYSIPFQPQPNTNEVTETAAATEDSANFELASPEGEYLIERRAGITEAELTNWATLNGIKIRRAFELRDKDFTLLDDYYLLDTKTANEQVTDLIVNSDLTAWVEINEVVAAELPQTANPITSRKNTYGINDPGASEQWMMEALNMAEYYRLLDGVKPKKKAKIAILDTGVDASHEDLNANYVSTQSKYDDDPRGHGTHCAGIAGAVTNNGIGMGSLAGSGNFVEITSIKVLNSGGMGTQSTIIQGILEAADSGADVISLSLGANSNSKRQRAYNQAVSYARRNKCIVLAAAGNSNRAASGYSPANAAGIICVSAIDNLQLRAPFSNKVQGVKMPIAAPGVAIYSSIPGSKYGTYSGTSMACPFVAGLVGVLRSINPELETDAIYDILQKSGKRSSEYADIGPIVQPVEALKLVLK